MHPNTINVLIIILRPTQIKKIGVLLYTLDNAFCCYVTDVIIIYFGPHDSHSSQHMAASAQHTYSETNSTKNNDRIDQFDCKTLIQVVGFTTILTFYFCFFCYLFENSIKIWSYMEIVSTLIQPWPRGALASTLPHSLSWVSSSCRSSGVTSSGPKSNSGSSIIQ